MRRAWTGRRSDQLAVPDSLPALEIGVAKYLADVGDSVLDRALGRRDVLPKDVVVPSRQSPCSWASPWLRQARGKLSLFAAPYFYYTGNMINKSTPVEQKKRGRPEGSAFAEPFPMRFTADQVGAIDEWRRAQPDLPARSEAIRRLVEAALAGSRPVAPPARRKESAAEKSSQAKSFASKAADKAMSGQTTSIAEKARRRGSLVDEPAAVAKARSKRR